MMLCEYDGCNETVYSEIKLLGGVSVRLCPAHARIWQLDQVVLDVVIQLAMLDAEALTAQANAQCGRVIDDQLVNNAEMKVALLSRARERARQLFPFIAAG